MNIQPKIKQEPIKSIVYETPGPDITIPIQDVPKQEAIKYIEDMAKMHLESLMIGTIYLVEGDEVMVYTYEPPNDGEIVTCLKTGESYLVQGENAVWLTKYTLWCDDKLVDYCCQMPLISEDIDLGDATYTVMGIKDRDVQLKKHVFYIKCGNRIIGTNAREYDTYYIDGLEYAKTKRTTNIIHVRQA